MLLRIGVNLGDIIHDGTRTFGDGINVAARLEPLAEPGGICISANGARRDLRQARPAPARSRREIAQEHRPAGPHLPDPGAGDACPPRLAWRGSATISTARSGARARPSPHRRRRRWRVAVLAARDARSPTARRPSRCFRLRSAAVIRPRAISAQSFARDVSAYLSTFPGMRIVSPSDPSRKLAAPTAAQEIRATYALGGDVAKSGGQDAGHRAADRRRERRDRRGRTATNLRARTGSQSRQKTARKIYGALGRHLSARSRKTEMEKAWRKAGSRPSPTTTTIFGRVPIYMTMYAETTLLGRDKLAEEGLGAVSPTRPLLKICLACDLHRRSRQTFGPFANCHETVRHLLGRYAARS